MKFCNIVGGIWRGQLPLNWISFGTSGGLNNERENYKLIWVLGIGIATWFAADEKFSKLTDGKGFD